ncbi:hypothetical protein GOBAR_DD06285 [Gossypium barbadense]|nr:hypothetical protein GOBAR_DD06285 [Gossypium barbadense]
MERWKKKRKGGKRVKKQRDQEDFPWACVYYFPGYSSNTYNLHRELLLQYGANVNASNSSGHTPLHLCILSEKYAIVKLLLTRGVDSNVVDEEGSTAVQLALTSGIDENEVLTFLADSNR